MPRDASRLHPVESTGPGQRIQQTNESNLTRRKSNDAGNPNIQLHLARITPTIRPVSARAQRGQAATTRRAVWKTERLHGAQDFRDGQPVVRRRGSRTSEFRLLHLANERSELLCVAFCRTQGNVASAEFGNDAVEAVENVSDDGISGFLGKN